MKPFHDVDGIGSLQQSARLVDHMVAWLEQHKGGSQFSGA